MDPNHGSGGGMNGMVSSPPSGGVNLSSLPFPVLLPSSNEHGSHGDGHDHHNHNPSEASSSGSSLSPYLSFDDSLNVSSSTFTSYALPNNRAPSAHNHNHAHDDSHVSSSTHADPLTMIGNGNNGNGSNNNGNGNDGGMVNRTRAPIASSSDHGHSHAHGGHNHNHSHGGVTSRTSDRMAGFGNAPISSLPRGESFANRLRNGSFIRYVQSTAWRERDSRLLFIFIAMKFGIMILQFTYGVASSATGVIASSFHTGFDCLALFTALGAMVMARKPAKFPFAYGYDRFEVLAGFTNSIFLFFVATFLIIESFHRVYKQPEVHSDDLVLAAIGLTIDIIGIAFFHEHATLRQTSELVAQHQSNIRADRGHDGNVHGVLLHIMADALTHTGLIIATWLVRWKEWYLSHAVVWFVVSIVILRAVYPLFRQTGLILLQTTSSSIQSGLERCVREISFYDGVLECRSAHWWTQSPGVTIGTLHVRLRAEADEQATLLFAHNLLKKYVSHATIQIEKEQLVDWMPALI